MRASVVLGVPVQRTARVMQAEGLFDIPPLARSETRIDADLPLGEKPWRVGLIVGPSGSGKSSVARALWPDEYAKSQRQEWHSQNSVLDGFPPGLGVKDIVGLMSRVGFSSPPSWLRPYGALSTGEQFRVSVARALADAANGLAVIDEFTSVVDRTVAKVASSAIGEAVRAGGAPLVAVSCHYDIIEWLNPDWVLNTADMGFAWRSLRRRPAIEVRVERVANSAWRLFRHHHYLSADLHHAAACFVGFVGPNPAVFSAWLHQPHQKRSSWREHRTVCLPDFQGTGLGSAVADLLAGCYAATGKPVRSVSGHPSVLAHRTKGRGRTLWRMAQGPSLATRADTSAKRTTHLADTNAVDRLTVRYEYRGKRLSAEARALGIIR